MAALEATRLRAVPNDEEIARVLEVPLADLLRADARLPAEPDRPLAALPAPGRGRLGRHRPHPARLRPVVRAALAAAAPAGAC